MKTLYSLFAIIIVSAASTSCNSSESTTMKEESVPVEIMTVSRGEVVQSLSYDGDINAEFEVNVFSKISDRIEKFYVDEGDYVQKGQALARITATTIEQGVKQAEAALIAAQAQEANLRVEYERAQRLMNEDAMSKQQYDATKTQYEAISAQVDQAKAALVSAKSQLQDAVISAPISGIIGKRYYEDGDMANMVNPLVRIVQMERVKIEFHSTEEDLGRLAVGQNANVVVKAFPDKIFEGKVIKISPVLDPQTRMADVDVLVNNSGQLLKPGMFARVEVITNVLHDVIVVPRYAAIENTSMKKINGEDIVYRKYFVFVVDSNRAFQKQLDVQYVNHKSIAVQGGIDVGDQLVVAGQNNLRDSMLVSATKGVGL